MAIESPHLGGAFRLLPKSITNTHIADNAGLSRAKLALDSLKPFVIPWSAWRVWNALDTNLPGTSANDDLGLVGGTFGTNSPSLQSYDVKTAGAVTLYARAMIALPAEYEATQNVQLRFSAGMVTTVADTTATLDVEAYKSDNFAGVGSDLVTTNAQDMNDLSAADLDFALDASTLLPGDWLDVRIAMAINDAATGTAVIGRIGYAALLCDVRG